ncbi:MAG: transposase, partial [Desulfamplus sp.]|nr:transposase [Desulfamplus sp.]
MSFFFPAVHAGIDWTKEYTFLDKEFQKLFKDSQTGRRYADKLVKVHTCDGTPLLVMIHVEVQSSYERDFARRMYTYNYRIFDRLDEQVISLAVLADESKIWYPS